MRKIKYDFFMLFLPFILAILLFLLIYLISSFDNTKNIGNKLQKSTVSYNGFKNLYSAAIKHIKKCEGFCGKPTMACGYLTIGYGHLIKDTTIKSISEKEAEDILKKDLNTCIKFVENKTNLRNNKSLALGMLGFNIGTTRLLQYMERDSILQNIDKIVYYCNYHMIRDGKKINIKSKALQKRREFEIYIYKYGNGE